MELKTRTKDNTVRKVLIYGEDGSGKSTFAEKYCEKNGLKPICIDVDDTNWTDVPIVNIDLFDNATAFADMLKTLNQIDADDKYDTIIIDGVSSLLELLVSDAKGMLAYSDRSKRFAEILKTLRLSKKNIIFIGQIDMRIVHNEEHQTPKVIVKINSMVNEKYYTFKDEGKFSHTVEKYRALDQDDKSKSTVKTAPKKNAVRKSNLNSFGGSKQ